MPGANYDIIAQGQIDKYVSGNPTSTYWRSVHQRSTRFAIESISQPFNTVTHWGQEAQISINRAGDMLYNIFLHVQLPGIVACDTKTEQCAGIAGNNMFPSFNNGGSSCNPCSKNDELALLEYLPADFGTMSDAMQAAALKDARNKWRREKLGAGTELGCCVDGESDCPDQTCPELEGVFAHWCNDVGHFMISKAKLNIGGQQVDQLTGTFLFCWEELTGKAGRRLSELTLRRYTRSQLICDSRESRDLYIPLPFFFTNNTGSALPLTSLAYHGVNVHVEFERLEKLIVVSSSDVVVKNARTALAIQASDLKCDLELFYVYLDQQERDKFSAGSWDQLVVQTQHYFKAESKPLCHIPLSFNHPQVQLIFCVRRQCQEQANNWTNLSGHDGRDPIEFAELTLNTTSRFGRKPALYWRGVIPYLTMSNIPESYVYTMNFSINPEEAAMNPSGSCNFSRIDNVELSLQMQSGLQNETYTVYVFSRSYNIIKYKDGVAGMTFG